MPIATPEQYREMIDAAFNGQYAYPAINVSSMVTANAALKGFADKKSDGIIQVSTGAGKTGKRVVRKVKLRKVLEQPEGLREFSEFIVG